MMAAKSGTNGKNLAERITEACAAVDPDMLKRIQRYVVHRFRKCVEVGVDMWRTYCPSNKAYIVYLPLVPDFFDNLCIYQRLLKSVTLHVVFMGLVRFSL
jgi:hypothetical protein